MATFILISIVGGILFGVMDAVINANPAAQRLFKAYAPIAKKSINPVAGIVIDLVYGFAMAGVFLILYSSLPGASGWIKGLSFGGMVWFFRVFMQAASQFVMFAVPVQTLLYTLATGLGEMLILGILYGLSLRPTIFA